MKYLLWIIGIPIFIIVAMLVVTQVASERVEVVELHAMDEAGSEVTTRLWVADYEGGMYLRVGSDGSGWYSRLLAEPNVRITRGDKTGNFVAISDPSKSIAINELMAKKYTWSDSLIAVLVGSREGSIPILLQPTDG